MGKTPKNRSKSPAVPTDSTPVKAASRTRRVPEASPSTAPLPRAAQRSVPADSSSDPATSAAESAPVSTNSGQPQAAAAAPQKRFDIFVADVGWNSPVAEAIRKNIEICLSYQANSTAYVLSKDQCMQLFHMHPSMIGTEPSIIFIDREAYAANRSRGFGFKLNLGLIRDVPTANNLLKWILAVLAEQKPGSDITEPIRTVIHKEGFRGAVDILADITRSPVGETVTH